MTLLCGALLTSACADLEDATGDTSAALVAGTPDAVGIVRFVNAATTSRAVLDDEVPLDSRAAENLYEGRPFANLDAIDAVPYVGPTALARLRDYALAHDFVPEGDDLLGVYDGVPFTVDEADRALALVNDASDGVLSQEVGLVSRAVQGILDARPLRSMRELEAAYYVGPAMMGRIWDYIAVPDGPVDCRATSDCSGELRCVGRPADGSSEYGLCRDLAPIDGQGAYCNGAVACGAGLFCNGVSLWGEGDCAPLWMTTSVTSTTQRAIPSDTPVPVATAVLVRGQATVPVDIAVDVDLSHSAPHSLRIAVRDPNGDEAVIWDGPSAAGPFPGSFLVGGGISRDDAVNGRWMLRIWNPGGVGTGTLRGWTLDVSSRWD